MKNESDILWLNRVIRLILKAITSIRYQRKKNQCKEIVSLSKKDSKK